MTGEGNTGGKFISGEVFSPWSADTKAIIYQREKMTTDMISELWKDVEVNALDSMANTAKEALLSIEDVARTVSNTFADAIVNATNLQDAMASIAQQMQRMVLQRAIDSVITSSMSGGTPVGAGPYHPEFVPSDPLGGMGNPAPYRSMPSITIVGDASSTAKVLTTNTKLIRAMNQAYKQGYPSE